MNKITLRNYNIHLGPVKATLPVSVDFEPYSKIFVLVDELTEKHCLPLVSPLLPSFELIRIPSGELHKNMGGASLIWNSLIHQQADRKALMINLGGGVIGDMGGLCASTYKRGIDFMQVPTTLLSQVDASIGGKLAIDHQQIKNCIGLFNDPVTIIVDPSFLKTLPDRQLISGMAEILKHGLIGDQTILDRLYEMKDIRELESELLISDAIKVKQVVVEEDPFENGYRKVLNLGHTIGHAVESLFLESDNPMLHGEAIAVGLLCELYLSQEQLGMDPDILVEVDHFIQRWYNQIIIPQGHYADIIHLLLNDKKNEGGKINFSLLKDIDEPVINQIIDEEWILRALDFYNEKATTKA